MPTGATIGIALLGCVTLLALVPIRRPVVLAKLAFLVSASVNELPLLFIALLLLTIVPALAGGGVEGAGGWVVIGLGAAAIAGQTAIAWRGARTGPAVARALEEAFGDVAPTGGGGRSPIAPLLWPWPVRPAAVERIGNLSYGEAGRHNALDLYRHRSRPQRAPVLLYMHGGGYSGGDKRREGRPLLHRLAERGWVCLSANYRLRPRASFPEHLIDAKRAIAWVRARGADYGADPERLLVAGSSAGGHLAAFAALTQNDPALQPGFEEADTSVSAAITLAGYLGPYYGQGPESSPLAHVHAGAPPFFIAQGANDTFSPRFVDIARRFADGLRDVSAAPVVYAELPGGQHSFDVFHSLRFAAVIDGIESFAARVLSTPG